MRGGSPTGGQTGTMGGHQTASGSMRRGQQSGGGQSGQGMDNQHEQMGGQQGMQGGGQQGMQGGGQQMGGQQMGGQQGMQGGAPSFEDHLTNELRILLEDFSEVTHVAEWCATECAYAGPELATSARICEDIAEVAELNEKLIARDSPFGPLVAQTFVRVANQGLPELRRYGQQHPQIAETVATIERTINSCTALLDSGGQQGMQGGQRMGGRQMGGQGRHGAQSGTGGGRQ